MTRNSTTWGPGQSGNLAGRPRKSDEVKQAEAVCAGELTSAAIKLLRRWLKEADREDASREQRQCAKVAVEHIIKVAKWGEADLAGLALPENIADYRPEHWRLVRALADEHIAAAESGAEVH